MSDSSRDSAIATVSALPAERRLVFGGRSEFYPELRRRVQQYLQTRGKRDRDCPRMYTKSAVVLTALAASYATLVFAPLAWWLAIPVAFVLAISIAAVGFNIQHDGGHEAFSKHGWINRLTAMTLDLVGASSYVWHRKHVVVHHTYTNITGHDTDIELGWFGRLSPHQRWLPMHRFQQYYLWPLYGAILPKWQFLDDFRDVIQGKVGQDKLPRPKGFELFVFLGGKLVFISLAFIFPMLLHPIWIVIAFYGIISLVAGMLVSVVFQLAHCVDGTDFPVPSEETGRIENAWAIHQVETTVDFARSSRLATWLLGGLNFQVEHHLFPKVSHTHYPGISEIVEATCRDFGLNYKAHKSVWAGIVSHFRFLREMGRPDSTLAA